MRDLCRRIPAFSPLNNWVCAPYILRDHFLCSQSRGGTVEARCLRLSSGRKDWLAGIQCLFGKRSYSGLLTSIFSKGNCSVFLCINSVSNNQALAYTIVKKGKTVDYTLGPWHISVLVNT